MQRRTKRRYEKIVWWIIWRYVKLSPRLRRSRKDRVTIPKGMATKRNPRPGAFQLNSEFGGAWTGN